MKKKKQINKNRKKGKSVEDFLIYREEEENAYKLCEEINKEEIDNIWKIEYERENSKQYF